MIKQLHSDKIVRGNATGFQKELDDLVEEQIRLKAEEIKMMKKVKSS